MKECADGAKSLYLDIYQDGRRAYEFLKLYLVQEHTAADKARNKETMRVARAIQAKRTTEIMQGKAGIHTSMKMYSTAPLPFQGQKRRFLRQIEHMAIR